MLGCLLTPALLHSCARAAGRQGPAAAAWVPAAGLLPQRLRGRGQDLRRPAAPAGGGGPREPPTPAARRLQQRRQHVVLLAVPQLGLQQRLVLLQLRLRQPVPVHPVGSPRALISNVDLVPGRRSFWCLW